MCAALLHGSYARPLRLRRNRQHLPAKVKALVTERTKAVVITHMWGIPCRMDELVSICKKHDLLLLEDASHAHGATYRGRPAVCSAMRQPGVSVGRRLSRAVKAACFPRTAPRFIPGRFCWSLPQALLQGDSARRSATSLCGNWYGSQTARLAHEHRHGQRAVRPSRRLVGAEASVRQVNDRGTFRLAGNHSAKSSAGRGTVLVQLRAAIPRGKAGRLADSAVPQSTGGGRLRRNESADIDLPSQLAAAFPRAGRAVSAVRRNASLLSGLNSLSPNVTQNKAHHGPGLGTRRRRGSCDAVYRGDTQSGGKPQAVALTKKAPWAVARGALDQ